MERIAALLLPATEPSDLTKARLLVFFDALSFYLATEADAAVRADGNLPAGMISGYAPAPLAEDLSRFKRLLRDLETSRPEEISRLFAAAAMPPATGQARDPDETSSSRVFTALHKGDAAKAGARHKERLWQARLVLKLAELLDRREAEIRQGLANISAAQQKVFAALEGEDETATDDAPAPLRGLDARRQQQTGEVLPPPSAADTSGLLLPLRLKAWAELYLADPAEQRPAVLVAAEPESGTILLDGYENTWRRQPVKLFSLAIPTLHATAAGEEWQPYLAARQAFHEAVRETREYLAWLLQQTAASVDAIPDDREKFSMLAGHIPTWRQQLASHFAAGGTQAMRLDFYGLPSVSMAELLQRLFRLAGPVARTGQQAATGILAILNP